MKRISLFLLIAISCLSAFSQLSGSKNFAVDAVGADVCPPEIAPFDGAPFAMPDLKRPVFPERTFDISKKGAKEGKLCSGVIQKCIDQLSAKGGGTVVIPKGHWLTGRIILKDNINLHLDEGAVLQFSGDIKDYLPVVFTRNEGIELMSLGSLIYANGATNIAITGKGTLVSCPGNDDSEIWREQASNNVSIEARIDWTTPVETRIYDGSSEEAAIQLPMFFAPINCKNVLVEGVTFKNSIYWNIAPTYCDSVIIRGVTIKSEGGRTDGFDLDSSSNALIEYCTVTSGDDNFTLKAGRSDDGVRVNRPTENIVIRHCLSLKGAGGLTIGTETAGMIRNVWCHDCVMVTTNSGFYFKSRRNRGGGCENIFADRIKMLNVKKALNIDQLGSVEWIGELAKRRPIREITPVTPVIRNIVLNDVTVERCATAINVRTLGEIPIENLRLDSWDVNYHNPIKLTDIGDMEITNSTFRFVP